MKTSYEQRAEEEETLCMTQGRGQSIIAAVRVLYCCEYNIIIIYIILLLYDFVSILLYYINLHRLRTGVRGPCLCHCVSFRLVPLCACSILLYIMRIGT